MTTDPRAESLRVAAREAIAESVNEVRATAVRDSISPRLRHIVQLECPARTRGRRYGCIVVADIVRAFAESDLPDDDHFKQQVFAGVVDATIDVLDEHIDWSLDAGR